MSQHEDSIRLRHMLDHSREAVELATPLTRDDLDKNRLLQLSLTRLVEIVGEAASKVSADGRKEIPDIPWPDIVNTRHRLIHAYDFVDYDILWQTVKEDLPELIRQLENALSGGAPSTDSR